VSDAARHRRGATLRAPGLELVEHHFEVPLDPARPAGEQLELFAREVRGTEVDEERKPWLVFLQGGPGFEAPRPESRGGWIGRALQSYRVLLLDTRGTGRSTPLEARTLLALRSDRERLAYLRHFRAPQIVADCERVRAALAGPDQPWSVLGQSFGGFCATSYLSTAPSGLREVLITGGLPPLVEGPDPVYARTAAHTAARSAAYHRRFPDDGAVLAQVLQRLERGAVPLPGGDALTAARLQSLGLHLGFRDGPLRVHYLLERAFQGRGAHRDLSLAFLRGVENLGTFDTNPLYALLHEPCYAQGPATRWSAERTVRGAARFDPRVEPLPFTGEMVLRSTFADSTTLAPLLPLAEALAEVDDWEPLYDPAALARNTVPVVAAVYAEDLFVDRDFSLATGEAIAGARVWLTNEFEHCGLRVEGERVLGHLLDLLRGNA
jgi:pimeloyl-ACP methyl ester carboxylesterase